METYETSSKAWDCSEKGPHVSRAQLRSCPCKLAIGTALGQCTWKDIQHTSRRDHRAPDVCSCSPCVVRGTLLGDVGSPAGENQRYLGADRHRQQDVPSKLAEADACSAVPVRVCGSAIASENETEGDKEETETRWSSCGCARSTSVMATSLRVPDASSKPQAGSYVGGSWPPKGGAVSLPRMRWCRLLVRLR